ncbi:hypothetical protein [Streptomyces collinus]|uniref:hypothetical protein n=1 Tax=Streptomyces collinus TaxID=42684 RepID=UPI00369CED2B
MTITDSPYGSSYQKITLSCVVSDSRYKPTYAIWYGQDPTWDDYLFSHSVTTLLHVYNVSKTALNEDWGGDEVYAEVNFAGPDGGYSVPTNVVHGNW